jgi:hypothetical protein
MDNELSDQPSVELVRAIFNVSDIRLVSAIIQYRRERKIVQESEL